MNGPDSVAHPTQALTFAYPSGRNDTRSRPIWASMSEANSDPDRLMRSMLNKVPAVTIVFWLIKTLATTVGETAADYLNMSLKLGLLATSGLMAGLLIIALAVQLWTRRYIPAVYWLVVVLISVVGTLISDNLVDSLGVSLALSSTLFAAALAVVFGVWYAIEGTLSVHTITTTGRELFYWAAILFTFSLGTSAGDLIGEKLGLGYAWSVVLFLTLIGAVYAAWRFMKIDAVLAFWAAYVLTRPLGASTGDLLSQSPHVGGLGLGSTWTSVVFLAAIVVMVMFEAQRQGRVEAEEPLGLPLRKGPHIP